MSTGDGQPDRADGPSHVEYGPTIFYGVIASLIASFVWALGNRIFDLQRVASAIFLLGCVVLVATHRWDRRPPALMERPGPAIDGTTVGLFVAYLLMWIAAYLVGRTV